METPKILILVLGKDRKCKQQVVEAICGQEVDLSISPQLQPIHIKNNNNSQKISFLVTPDFQDEEKKILKDFWNSFEIFSKVYNYKCFAILLCLHSEVEDIDFTKKIFELSTSIVSEKKAKEIIFIVNVENDNIPGNLIRYLNAEKIISGHLIKQTNQKVFQNWFQRVIKEIIELQQKLQKQLSNNISCYCSRKLVQIQMLFQNFIQQLIELLISQCSDFETYLNLISQDQTGLIKQLNEKIIYQTEFEFFSLFFYCKSELARMMFGKLDYFKAKCSSKQFVGQSIWCLNCQTLFLSEKFYFPQSFQLQNYMYEHIDRTFCKCAQQKCVRLIEYHFPKTLIMISVQIFTDQFSALYYPPQLYRMKPNLKTLALEEIQEQSDSSQVINFDESDQDKEFKNNQNLTLSLSSRTNNNKLGNQSQLFGNRQQNYKKEYYSDREKYQLKGLEGDSIPIIVRNLNAILLSFEDYEKNKIFDQLLQLQDSNNLTQNEDGKYFTKTQPIGQNFCTFINSPAFRYSDDFETIIFHFKEFFAQNEIHYIFLVVDYQRTDIMVLRTKEILKKLNGVERKNIAAVVTNFQKSDDQNEEKEIEAAIKKNKIRSIIFLRNDDSSQHILQKFNTVIDGVDSEPISFDFSSFAPLTEIEQKKEEEQKFQTQLLKEQLNFYKQQEKHISEEINQIQMILIEKQQLLSQSKMKIRETEKSYEELSRSVAKNRVRAIN